MQLTASEAAAVMGAECRGSGEVLLTGAEVDSRLVGPGDLFVALPGARVDGHDYVAQALEHGAAALVRRGFVPPPIPPGRALLVVAEPLVAYHCLAGAVARRRSWTIAALTGSVGKTTTKDFLAAVVARRRTTGASGGNRNSTLGLPAELLSQPEDIDVFVAEAGMSHRGELELLGRILEPEVVIYTRIARAHTEFLGGLAGVIDAKAELLAHMPSGGRLVINHDDPNQRSFPGRAVSGARVVHYGRDAPEICYELLEDLALRGTRARLSTPDGDADVHLRLPGAHQLENLVAATAGAWALGVPVEAVAEAAPELRAARHRGEIHEVDGTTVVDDAYNASPAGMASALDLLGRSTGRRVAVLGGMFELGPEAETAHREIGALAADRADLLILVGGDDAFWFADGAAAAGFDSSRIHRVEDAEAAGHVVRELAQPGDVLLFKASRGVALERAIEILRGDD
jgi:UDP-N-acetylmuramoyl-tripeptide--D-alanyl-D-alanine ligase